MSVELLDHREHGPAGITRKISADGIELDGRRCRSGTWRAMNVRVGGWIGGALLGIVACGAMMAEEREVVLGGELERVAEQRRRREESLWGVICLLNRAAVATTAPMHERLFVFGPDNCYWIEP